MRFIIYGAGAVGSIIASGLAMNGYSTIIVGNYNRHSYDRTRWFALNDQDYFLTNYHPFDKFNECKRMFESNNTK